MGQLTPAQRVALAYQVERENGLPKGMLVAQLKQESSNGKNNYNVASGATGAMQFMPATAASLHIDPNDDEQAIPAAGKTMAQNYEQSGGNVPKALELYYAGSPKGIGPKSKAYVGQVGSKWSMADLYDDGAPSAPSAGQSMADLYNDKPTPAPASAPAAPTTGAPATTDPKKLYAQYTTGATEAPGDPRLAQLQQGIETVAKTSNNNPAMVRRFITDSGYDPDSLKNLDANVAAGNIQAGQHWWLKGVPFNATPIMHTPTNDLQAGIARGGDDVSGTLQNLAGYADAKYPWLAAIDNTASSVTGGFMPSAQGYQGLAASNQLNRKAYDANYGSFWSGAGRMGSQIALTAPVLGMGGKLAVAAAPEAAVPALNFLAGSGGTGIAGRAASLSAAGYGIGATQNALTASSSDQPFWQHVNSGGKVGAVVGPFAGAASAAVSKLAPGVDAATAKLAQIANDKYGLNLAGDQITNSPIVRRLSGMMNLSPINNHLARDSQQLAAWNRSVGQTFGADAPDGVLSPHVMQAARDKIGATMDGVAARTTIPADDTFLTDLGEAQANAQRSLPEGQYKPISHLYDDIITAAAKNNGTIPGKVYQQFTAKGAPLDNLAGNSDPAVQQAAFNLRNTLDDALERNAAPGDVEALRAARFQYKNLKTVEPLVSKSPNNLVSPQALNQRVSVQFKNRAYQGAGDLGELADIGKKFLAPPSSSGTAENAHALGIINGAGTTGAIGMALAGHALGYGSSLDVPAMGLYMGKKALGTATGAALNKYFQSPFYRNKLLDGAFDGNVAPAVNGLPPSLMLTGNSLLQRAALPPPQPQPVQPNQ